MLDLYREERGRGCHEGGIPLEAIRCLCDECGIEGEDRYLVIQAFLALDGLWLDWREKKRAYERAAAERAAKTSKRNAKGRRL